MTDGATSKGEGTVAQAELARLIGRVAERRDRAAFARLFRHCGPRIKGFMLKQGVSEETAEDLVQETMLTVWHKAASYAARKGSPGTWIFTIARNRRIDRLRRQAMAHHDDLLLAVPEEAASGEEEVTRRERRGLVARALAALPADQREVLRLAFIEDQTQSEIASRLGLPLGTVKSRMRLAYGRLREVLEDVR